MVAEHVTENVTEYVNKDDLLSRDESLVWTLATSADDASLLDDVAIVKACNDAKTEIDSFLTRFQLPLAQLPPLLNRVAISIAFYWLADRDNGISDLQQKRYDAALTTLREIQSGKRNLGLPQAEKPTETTSGKVEVIAAYRPSIRSGLGNTL